MRDFGTRMPTRTSPSPLSVAPLRLVPHNAVGVIWLEGQYRAVAARLIASGERILHAVGAAVKTPSRFSLQIGLDEHLDVPAGAGVEQQMELYPWRFLNHSCSPNATFRGRDLIALRPIAPREDITFDYHTTEYDMDAPFDCRCGASDCIGRIRGYRHLSPAARAARRSFVAPHVELLAAQSEQLARAGRPTAPEQASNCVQPTGLDGSD